MPAAAHALVLRVENADSPTPQPLVHAIVHGLPSTDGDIAEGELPSPADRSTAAVGCNSFLHSGWLPPDPALGHAPHRYVFQLYALDATPTSARRPDVAPLLAAMTGHVLAR